MSTKSFRLSASPVDMLFSCSATDAGCDDDQNRISSSLTGHPARAVPDVNQKYLTEHPLSVSRAPARVVASLFGVGRQGAIFPRFGAGKLSLFDVLLH